MMKDVKDSEKKFSKPNTLRQFLLLVYQEKEPKTDLASTTVDMNRLNLQAFLTIIRLFIPRNGKMLEKMKLDKFTLSPEELIINSSNKCNCTFQLKRSAFLMILRNGMLHSSKNMESCNKETG